MRICPVQRLRYEIDPKDVIGADAYQEAVRVLKRRNRNAAALATASGRNLGMMEVCGAPALAHPETDSVWLHVCALGALLVMRRGGRGAAPRRSSSC